MSQKKNLKQAVETRGPFAEPKCCMDLIRSGDILPFLNERKARAPKADGIRHSRVSSFDSVVYVTQPTFHR